MHTVAKGCSTGTLQLCGCASRPTGRGKDEKGEFQWAGCSDDVRFATTFTRKFVDAPERRNRDPMALMNLHNNRAGRKVKFFAFILFKNILILNNINIYLLP